MLDLSGIAKELFETHRGLIGQGHAQTHAILHRIVDYQVKGVPCGSWVYDWKIPDAWFVKEAWVAKVTAENCKHFLINFTHNPLHLVAHSMPVDRAMDFEELDEHLYVGGLSWIPHRTSYYRKDWGFCLTSKQYAELDRDAQYHVFIDSKFERTALVYGERTVGQGGEHYLINTYNCHPGMYNDNVSGMIVWALLLRYLVEKESKLKNTYTFVIAPETIGILTWLHENERMVERELMGAYTVAYCGGVGDFVYETTHQEVGEMDMAMILGNPEITTRPWSVEGSNGRQLASPGFRIPTGMLNRPAIYDSKYHTSMDDMRDYHYSHIMEAFLKHANAIGVLENDRRYQRKEPRGEPRLGRFGLYGNVGGNNQDEYTTYKLIAHHCNTYSLAEMAWVTGKPFPAILRAAKKMERAGIIKCVR